MLSKLTKIFCAFSTDIIQHTDTPELIRLSKWISHKSVCSRKQAEEFIKLGLIRIDGKRIYENLMIPYNAQMKAYTELGMKNEKPIIKLWMMNKPRGYICSHKDERKRPTIYSLIPPQFSVFGSIMSVGRLDYNSEGLILLTNDATVKNLLENPQARLPRFYRVKVHGRLTQKKIQLMNKPITINGIQYGPLKAKVDRLLTTNTWLNVQLMTGKNRQIRKIMQKCDLQVNKLIREEYGPYKLNSLKHGQIMQVEISKGLQRKVKLTKAEGISKLPKCLIEIDIRKEAISLAKQEKLTLKQFNTETKAIEEKQ